MSSRGEAMKQIQLWSARATYLVIGACIGLTVVVTVLLMTD